MGSTGFSTHAMSTAKVEGKLKYALAVDVHRPVG
jgi:hypothetical protein